VDRQRDNSIYQSYLRSLYKTATVDTVVTPFMLVSAHSSD